jgi:hypothetical protein
MREWKHIDVKEELSRISAFCAHQFSHCTHRASQFKCEGVKSLLHAKTTFQIYTKVSFQNLPIGKPSMPKEKLKLNSHICKDETG